MLETDGVLPDLQSTVHISLHPSMYKLLAPQIYGVIQSPVPICIHLDGDNLLTRWAALQTYYFSVMM